MLNTQERIAGKGIHRNYFFAVVIFKLYGIIKKGSGKRLKQVGMGSGTNKGNGFLIILNIGLFAKFRK